MRPWSTDPSTLAERPELMVTLEIAVPSWARRWRDARPDAQVARARSLAAVTGGHGDTLLYGPGKRHAARHHRDPDGRITTIDAVPSSADVFNALAEGIALLSILAAGGVNLWGRHWHDRCPAQGPWTGPGYPDACRDRSTDAPAPA